MPSKFVLKLKLGVAALTLLLSLYVLYQIRGVFVDVKPKLSNSMLVQLLAEIEYQAFNPPREQDATGTLIQLRDHGESIVSSTCFGSEKVQVQEIEISLGQYKYSQIGTDDLVAQSYWPAALRTTVNNSLARFEVETINIEFINPRQVRFETLDLRNYINSLPKEDSCRKEIESPGVYIIQSAILVDGMSVSFLGSTEKSALSEVELKDLSENEIRHKKVVNQNYKLIFKDFRFIGYRPYYFKENPALSGEGQLVQPLFEEFFQEKWH